MIIRGKVTRRIGWNIFIINTSYEEYKVVLSYRDFPEEYIRLNGCTCPNIGLIPGLTCQLDVTDDELMDIRFDLPDPITGKEEISTITNALNNGSTAFLERPCGCSLHISNRALGNSISYPFAVGQKWKHKVRVYKNRIEATAAHFVAEGES